MGIRLKLFYPLVGDNFVSRLGSASCIPSKGGWGGSTFFSAIMASAVRRNKLLNEMVNCVNFQGLDGLSSVTALKFNDADSSARQALISIGLVYSFVTTHTFDTKLPLPGISQRSRRWTPSLPGRCCQFSYFREGFKDGSGSCQNYFCSCAS